MEISADGLSQALVGDRAEITGQGLVLHRLLAFLLRQNGGRIEVAERDLQQVSPDAFVIQDPARNCRGNLVFRVVEERECPNCE